MQQADRDDPPAGFSAVYDAVSVLSSGNTASMRRSGTVTPGSYNAAQVESRYGIVTVLTSENAE